jgi:hypothetical protein
MKLIKNPSGQFKTTFFVFTKIPKRTSSLSKGDCASKAKCIWLSCDLAKSNQASEREIEIGLRAFHELNRCAIR